MRVFIFCLLLAGCANPKYLTPGEGNVRTAAAFGEVADLVPGPGRVWLTWEAKATTGEYGTFLLKIGRPNAGDGTPVPEDPASPPDVFLWMPDMGHGSIPVRIERVDVGTYRVSHVLFVMAGKWEIHVQLKDGNAIRGEATFPHTL